jgi:hypothetical protein
MSKWTSVIQCVINVLVYSGLRYILCFNILKGPGGTMSYVVGLPNTTYKPITDTVWVRTRLCILQKGCTRLAATSDKVYQLFAHGWGFSPSTPSYSTTKTGRHDIAEILLNTKNQIKNSNLYFTTILDQSFPIRQYVIVRW